MKIGIIASHFWPIPNKIHTGDSFYMDLARTLDEMGHTVNFFAPDGSYVPPHGQQFTMPCAHGKGYPSSEEYEQQCFDKYANVLRNQDIIHDFSATKRIAENLYKEGYRNIASTNLGGNDWKHPSPSHNIILSSIAMKDRAMRGATDYENTPTPYAAGTTQTPIKNAHVVYYGIDTDFYCPGEKKSDFFLWCGRWHPVRGYEFAIRLAKETGIELVMAGSHPNDEEMEHQKQCANEAMEMAKGIPNISFEFLPPDPEHHIAKRKMYREAKAFLYPVQFNEPFGLMQAEVLACGTPIIATNYGSMPEIIKHGITGYVVENNIQAFANVIDCIDSIDLKECRKDAVDRFDRFVMAKSYLKEYEMILQGKYW